MRRPINSAQQLSSYQVVSRRDSSRRYFLSCGLLSLFLLLLLASVSPAVNAVALGVNKASLDFSGVLRGGYAEDVVTVTTDSEDMLSAEVTLDGDAAPWIAVSGQEFNFSRDQPYQLKVWVQPPLDTQVQAYSANLRILTREISRSSSGKLGTSTRASFRIPISVGISGTERIECKVTGVRVLDTEVGQPLEVRLSLINRGNVRINPEVTLEFWNSVRSKIIATAKTDFGERVLPTIAYDAVRSIRPDLPLGQYWVTIKVPLCGDTSMDTFDVLEPGGIKDDGEFVRLDAPSWANTGDIIPLKAIFKNKGTRGVRAVFKGTITDIETGEIMKVISTDEYVVAPGVTAELQTFFNPQVAGKYQAQGKILYNNKLTIERDAIMNVNGAAMKKGSSMKTFIILFVFLLIILLLLILIKRRRKRDRPQVHVR